MSTKDKILEAAYTFIAQHGYEKTSIALISEAVNIKKASIYYYFKTKEDILLTLIDTFTNYASMFDIIKYFSKDMFIDKLKQYGYETIDMVREDTRIHAFTMEVYNLANKMDSVKEKIVDFTSYTGRSMVDILEHGVEIEALPKDLDIKLNAQLLAIVLDGICADVVYNHQYNYNTIWTKTIDRMYMDIN